MQQALDGNAALPASSARTVRFLKFARHFPQDSLDCLMMFETFCERFDFRCVPADQDGVRHDRVAVLQLHTALLHDCKDRAYEMLVGAHPPGDAVHDDAKPLFGHFSAPSCVDFWQRQNAAPFRGCETARP